PIALRLAGEPALAEATHGELARSMDVWSRLDDVQRSLLEASFEQLETNAQNRALGLLQTDPTRSALPLHVLRDGRDLKVFVESVLLGAGSFARGVGELTGAALGVSTPAESVAGQSYSALEHAWDVGFGYFGAARDFDGDAAGSEAARLRRDGWFDTDGDGRVRLLAEVNLGVAALALPTPALAFAREAFEALLAGRQRISDAAGPLDADGAARLLAIRDAAVAAWERTLAAIALHDLNLLVEQVERARRSSADYSFAAQARAWSELKGLALALRLNPRSPLSAVRFEALHASIGAAPSVPDTLPPRNTDELEAYCDRLGRARDVLVGAYGFDADAARY
ncbi:MAG TPA: hypothetical protein VMG12_38590, partial [Polyangiaceae bacterium]|nr:hypothetical protein [Polyangiaceae bacterium]